MALILFIVVLFIVFVGGGYLLGGIAGEIFSRIFKK